LVSAAEEEEYWLGILQKKESITRFCKRFFDSFLRRASMRP
jgi:hypothetical protein